MIVGHSIVAGNAVQEVDGAQYAHDLYTGSLVHFRSAGHNRIGVLDFSQMLVPLGTWDWRSLTRRHYPQVGDREVTGAGEVLDLAAGISRDDGIASVGVDAGHPVVLHYAPQGNALDQIPAAPYTVAETRGQYRVAAGAHDDFLAIVLARVESRYALPGFARAFTAAFEAFLGSVDADAAVPGVQPYAAPDGSPILTLADTRFFGPPETWPREPSNQPYIEFWHRLDADLGTRALPGMGPEGLGDGAWQALFASGALAENPAIELWMETAPRLTVQREPVDQRGLPRPAVGPADIGAIERP